MTDTRNDQRETISLEAAYQQRLGDVPGVVLSWELRKSADDETWDVVHIAPSRRFRRRYNATATCGERVSQAVDLPGNIQLRVTDAAEVLNWWENNWRNGNNREAAR